MWFKRFHSWWVQLIAGSLLIAAARGAVPIAEYAIDTWTTADGLPQNSVVAMAQTTDGYLWLATFNGLVRFDGTQFTVFDPENAPVLVNPQIRALHADRQGRLWIQDLSGGLYRFEDGRFTSVNALRQMLEFWDDPDGTVWLGDFRGRGELFRGDGENFTRTPLPAGCPTNMQVRLWKENDDRMWVMTRNQFGPLINARFVPLVSGHFIGDSDGIGLERPATPPVWPFSSPSGGFWINGTNAAQRILYDGTVAEAFTFPQAVKHADNKFLEERNGTIWMRGDERQLWRRATNGQWSVLTSEQGLYRSLRCIFEDREHSVWVGTDGAGLHRLRPQPVKTFDERDGLASNAMTFTLTEDTDGKIWVGAFPGGLRELKGERFTLFPKEGRGYDTAQSLLPTKRGIWVGWGSGVVSRIEDGVIAEEYPVEMTQRAIRGMCQDRTGALWLGHEWGLLRLGNGAFSRYGPAEGIRRGVYCVVMDAVGDLWFSSEDVGLFKYRDGTFTPYTNGLPNLSIRCLAPDADGGLWIGTYGGGLGRYKDGKFFRCTMKDGLSDKTINCILDDGLGYLWISGARGLGRVARADLEAFFAGRQPRVHCAVYGLRDGLASLESRGTFQPSGCKARDGRLWFSMLKGVSMVDPKALRSNHVPPPMVIQEILVNGKNQSDAGQITIPPGRHRLEIAYAALSFVRPESNRYKYRLRGVDEDWVDAGARRTASYTALAPGTYRFEVMGSNNDGVWSEGAATLGFVMQPYLWQTWWFRIVSALVLIGGIVGLVRYASVLRLRRRLTDLERRHALEHERVRISRDLHDNLGADLSQLALWSELAAGQTARPEEMAARVRSVSSLAREVIQNVEEIVWTVNPRNDSLNSFAAYVCDFSERVVTSAGLRFRWEAPDNIPAVPLPSDIRHHLFLVTKEALNNLVKHAAATEARVQLSVEGGVFVLAISDNGHGFDEAPASTNGGNGLTNMRARVADCGGQLTIESQNGSGTTIRLRVPLAILR